MYPVDLLDLLNRYDLVLLDSSFFQGMSGIRTFNELGSTFELELIRRELETNADHWSWVNKNMVTQPQVYTTPAVVEELKCFHELLKNRYKFCSGRAKQSPSRKLSAERAAKKELWKKRMDDLDKEYHPKNHPKPSSGLAQLGRMAHVVRKAIKQTQVYSPDGFTFEDPSQEISPADYELISAGISYLSGNPEHRVGVFTRDHHHIQIYKDYLQPSSSGPGTITVLRFHQGPIVDGKLNLRQKVSGYYPLEEEVALPEEKRLGGIEGRV